VVLMVSGGTGSETARGNGWRNGGERRGTLPQPDPLVAVEPEVAIGDHGAGLGELVQGAKEQRGGAVDSGSHQTPRRIERHGAGRVGVGETLPASVLTNPTARLPATGVGGVLEERCERLGELDDAVERGDGRPVARWSDKRRSV
jgi:hypothetical protein